MQELLAVANSVRTDITHAATGNGEVAERLVVVSDGAIAVPYADGIQTYRNGGVIAFINDSGIPFAEQAEQFVELASSMNPQAVLLGGSALTGNLGSGLRRVLAVQLFAARPRIRQAWFADITDARGLIISVSPWREAKAGPPIWAEQILSRADRE
ncbi:hypothetical protein [Nonomuraea maheshkhaliensis]